MAASPKTCVLDSDVLIECLKGNTVVLTHVQQLLETGASLLVSPVTIAEIHAGLLPAERDAVDTLLHSLVTAPVTREIGETAGALLQRHAKPHGLRLADALIAATAVQHVARLFTLNVKHFSRLDLSLYIPREAE